LVLDKSKSMFTNDITPGVTRWSQLHDTVTSITTSFDAAVNFGGVLFPSTDATSSGTGSCTVTEAVTVTEIAAMGGSAVVASMPAAATIDTDAAAQGGTPAHDGLALAYDRLGDALTVDATIPAFAILITDGAANCNTDSSLSNADTCGGSEGYANALRRTYDARLEPAVTTAFGDGIPTYVVGIGMEEDEKTCEPGSTFDLSICSDPWRDEFGDCIGDFATNGTPGGTGSEIVPWDRLDDLADAGGKPQAIVNPGDSKFYNAADPTQLETALNDILSQLVSCELDLGFQVPNPTDPDSLVVTVPDPMNPGTDLVVPQVDCSMPGASGWWYPNAPGDYSIVELCGTFCDALITAGTADVDVFCDAG
jgi:hypothetical protein